MLTTGTVSDGDYEDEITMRLPSDLSWKSLATFRDLGRTLLGGQTFFPSSAPQLQREKFCFDWGESWTYGSRKQCSWLWVECETAKKISRYLITVYRTRLWEAATVGWWHEKRCILVTASKVAPEGVKMIPTP